MLDRKNAQGFQDKVRVGMKYNFVSYYGKLSLKEKLQERTKISLFSYLPYPIWASS